MNLIHNYYNVRIGDLNQGEDAQFQHSLLMPGRKCKDRIMDRKGRQLVDFLESSGFMVVNGRSEGDALGEYTFHDARGTSTIDLCWVNHEVLGTVNNFQVGSELGCNDSIV